MDDISHRVHNGIIMHTRVLYNTESFFYYNKQPSSCVAMLLNRKHVEINGIGHMSSSSIRLREKEIEREREREREHLAKNRSQWIIFVLYHCSYTDAMNSYL